MSDPFSQNSVLKEWCLQDEQEDWFWLFISYDYPKFQRLYFLYLLQAAFSFLQSSQRFLQLNLSRELCAAAYYGIELSFPEDLAWITLELILISLPLKIIPFLFSIKLVGFWPYLHKGINRFLFINLISSVFYCFWVFLGVKEDKQYAFFSAHWNHLKWNLSNLIWRTFQDFLTFVTYFKNYFYAECWGITNIRNLG